MVNCNIATYCWHSIGKVNQYLNSQHLKIPDKAGETEFQQNISLTL